MEPTEFRTLVDETKKVFQSLGEVTYGILPEELKSLTFKRSLYIVEDMSEGETLTEKNLRIIRPGLGLAPKYFDQMLGKKVNRSVIKGTALTLDLII
jgi:N-acetylneuraminate synthase